MRSRFMLDVARGSFGEFFSSKNACVWKAFYFQAACRARRDATLSTSITAPRALAAQLLRGTKRSRFCKKLWHTRPFSLPLSVTLPHLLIRRGHHNYAPLAPLQKLTHRLAPYALVWTTLISSYCLQVECTF